MIARYILAIALLSLVGSAVAQDSDRSPSGAIDGEIDMSLCSPEGGMNAHTDVQYQIAVELMDFGGPSYVMEDIDLWFTSARAGACRGPWSSRS